MGSESRGTIPPPAKRGYIKGRKDNWRRTTRRRLGRRRKARAAKVQRTWFNYRDFYDWIASQGFDRLCEVGVWEGESLARLAYMAKRKNPKVKLWAVDLFEDTYRYRLYHQLQRRANVVKDTFEKTLYDAKVFDLVTPIKGFSWDMAEQFDDGYFDFVFIDADHSYPAVQKDIAAWLPKVRDGGILAGHDYGNTYHPGVKVAVDEVFKDVNTEEGTVWWVRV